jgi:hypothetical protein
MQDGEYLACVSSTQTNNGIVFCHACACSSLKIKPSQPIYYNPDYKLWYVNAGFSFVSNAHKLNVQELNVQVLLKTYEVVI